VLASLVVPQGRNGGNTSWGRRGAAASSYILFRVVEREKRRKETAAVIAGGLNFKNEVPSSNGSRPEASTIRGGGPKGRDADNLKPSGTGGGAMIAGASGNCALAGILRGRGFLRLTNYLPS